MKDIIENIFGFLYTLSMGDYIFLTCTFIILIALLYVLYLLKKDETILNNQEINSIESIKEHIEKEYKPLNIELTDYEKEQEETAIISYEELINNKNKLNVSYDEEFKPETSEVLVKKININETKEESNMTSDLQVRLMSYDKEEAFLKALKQLQQNLSN